AVEEAREETLKDDQRHEIYGGQDNADDAYRTIAKTQPAEAHLLQEQVLPGEQSRQQGTLFRIVVAVEPDPVDRSRKGCVIDVVGPSFREAVDRRPSRYVVWAVNGSGQENQSEHGPCAHGDQYKVQSPPFSKSVVLCTELCRKVQ